MDPFTVGLSVVLVGLSAILAGIAAAAAARFRDGRLATVAVAQGVFGAVGVASLLHQLSPRFGGGLGVDPVPLLLIVAGVGLLYAALVRQPTARGAAEHG